MHFYIQYVFGGVWYENQHYPAFLTYISGQTGGYNYYSYEHKITVLGTQMPIGNYFSLIATIITMIAIILFCVFIIKKIIGIMFRLATGSSAF